MAENRTHKKNLDIARKVCERLIESNQFTFFGDSNHNDFSNTHFFLTKLDKTFKKADVKHVVFEASPNFGELVDKFKSGAISRDELENTIREDFSSGPHSFEELPEIFADFAEFCKKSKIQLHVLDRRDSDEWYRDIDFDSIEPKKRLEVFRDVQSKESLIADEYLAKKIKDVVQDEKTVVFYGAGHMDEHDGSNQKNLDEWLGDSVSHVRLVKAHFSAENSLRDRDVEEFQDTIIVTYVWKNDHRFKTYSASNGKNLGGEFQVDSAENSFPEFEVTKEDLRDSKSPLELKLPFIEKFFTRD